MPESINSCGELSAPPHSSTSRAASSVTALPLRVKLTPLARFASSKVMAEATAPVSTVRLRRERIGLR